LDILENSSVDILKDNIRDHILGEATIIGTADSPKPKNMYRRKNSF
jgi:hypothetical protein